DADELRAELGDAALVSFGQAGGELHAVVLGADQFRLCRLGPVQPVVEQIRRVRADLDAVATVAGTASSGAAASASLRAAVLASLQRTCSRLDELLLRPLPIGDVRLVVASTGVLGQVPWHELPSGRGRPVLLAPSATVWHAAARAPSQRRREVIAFAGPALS